MSVPEVYVTVWADAHGSTGDMADHEIDHKPYIYTTVGLKIKSDDNGVSIAFEQGEDGRWRDVSFIPRLMVLEEYSLGPLKKPKARKLRKPKPEQSNPEPTRAPI